MQEYKPLQLTAEKLMEKAKSLPISPGIYLFFNAKGEIIYVGKSRALKNRVLSYFQNRGKHTPKTEKLVQSVADFQTIVTSSEAEALILENEKIKHHQPKFNIRLKDDKDYPYIRLSMGDAYPRLSFARRRKDNDSKARYFGPFSSSATVRLVIDTANKLFGLPVCKKKFPQEIGKSRPCLYYQMGRCMGVCTGKISPEEYAARLEEVVLFLKHDHKRIATSLQKEMEKASEALDFEKAAVLRDRIRALGTLSDSKQVVRDLHFHADVFGVFFDELGGCINLLSVREGRVADSTNFHFGADEILTPESFSSLLLSLYRGREELPKTILLPEEVWSEDLSSVNEALLLSTQRKIRWHLPERGEGKALLQMAMDNAKAAALHRRAEFEKDEEVLVALAKLLSLEVFPQRIESIDISNSGASAISAGVIALENGRFLKRAYKSFSLERSRPDDPACMYEAIYRRVLRAVEGDEAFLPLPDLILVDGADAQVNAVKRALTDLKVMIPVFGMVKDEFHKTRCLTDGEREISIAFDPKLFQFIYRIQEEVHRFSLSRMDAKRRKSVKGSSLSCIDGIGEKKAEALLKHFRSIKAIKEADITEIIQVKGISQKDARAVYQYFHGNNGKEQE